MTFSIATYMKCSFALGAICFTLGMASQASATTTKQLDEIAQRIEPVGVVCIEGQICGAEQTKAITVADNKTSTSSVKAEAEAAYSGRAPQNIYNRYCIACHASGAAGAPRLGNAKEWQPHIAKGMDTMLKNVIHGIGAMPPKGICSDCTDEELKHTIQYMINQSQ